MCDCRKELETGEYVFYVNGVAQTSNYILTVYITEERELNPFEEIVVGQVLFSLKASAREYRSNLVD